MTVEAPAASAARQRLRRILATTPLFRDLDAPTRDAIEHKLTLMVLPGGAPLFHPGEPADAVYVLASGCLGVFRHEPEDLADEPLAVGQQKLVDRRLATRPQHGEILEQSQRLARSAVGQQRFGLAHDPNRPVLGQVVVAERRCDGHGVLLG